MRSDQKDKEVLLSHNAISGSDDSIHSEQELTIPIYLSRVSEQNADTRCGR